MFKMDGLVVDAGAPDEADVARIISPGSTAVGDLLMLSRLLSSPEVLQSTLDGLTAQVVKANEAKASLINQQAEHDARHSELAEWESRISKIYYEMKAEQAIVANMRQQLQDISRDITNNTDVFKREVLRYAGYAEIDNRLQSLPDWPGLARAVLISRADDAHFDGNEGTPRDPAGETEALVPEHAVQGTSLTQSAPTTSRKSQRRG